MLNYIAVLDHKILKMQIDNYFPRLPIHKQIYTRKLSVDR